MSGRQQTVLITGGTDGLGKAAALLLAERGYRVFAAGRSVAKRQEIDRLAAEKKLALESLELDVCDDASVQRAVQDVLQKAGAIDVLINNAGIGYLAVIEDLRLADLRQQFETNLFGVLRVTQAVLPQMRRAETRPHPDAEQCGGDRDAANVRRVQQQQACAGRLNECFAPGDVPVRCGSDSD